MSPASAHQPIRVTAGSRLHFGLLSLHARAARQFGGVGLMVESPGLELELRPAQPSELASLPRGRTVLAEGPLAERAAEFAARFLAERFLADAEPPAVEPPPPAVLCVRQIAPEHVGLGTGTALGLAVAAALAEWTGLPHEQRQPADLARRVGRGARSAIGLHGFALGGLLVDGGKRTDRPDSIAPLLARQPFPADWRVLLILPRRLRGLSGSAERQAFAELCRQADPWLTDRLCERVLLGLLPAAAEADLPAFGEALFELQELVGQQFRSAQGGIYAAPFLAELVGFLRSLGVTGVGQSSWGPTLYAVTPDADFAAWVAAQLRRRFPDLADDLLVTAARNCAASLTPT